MTVRTWITISVLALVGLTTATAYQFLRPVQPPQVVVHAGNERINGAFAAACWPQRTGVLRCTREKNATPRETTIPSKGTLRVVLASPAQPTDGSIVIRDQHGETVLRTGWKRTVRYDLEPGTYTLTAQAGASDNAFVRYVFTLKVTRSGS